MSEIRTLTLRENRLDDAVRWVSRVLDSSCVFTSEFLFGFLFEGTIAPVQEELLAIARRDSALVWVACWGDYVKPLLSLPVM